MCGYCDYCFVQRKYCTCTVNLQYLSHYSIVLAPPYESIALDGQTEFEDAFGGRRQWLALAQ